MKVTEFSFVALKQWLSDRWARVDTYPPYFGHGGSWDLQKFDEFYGLGGTRVGWEWSGVCGVSGLCNEPVFFNQ